MLPTHSASNLKYKIDPPDYVFPDGNKFTIKVERVKGGRVSGQSE